MRAYGKNHDLSCYLNVPQPVWIEGNAYDGYAKPFRAEAAYTLAQGMAADVEEHDGKWVLTLTVPENVSQASCQAVTTERLGMPRITEQPYENADGSPIDFTRDYLGNHRTGNVIPGPFAALQPGENTFTVWEDSL